MSPQATAALINVGGNLLGGMMGDGDDDSKTRERNWNRQFDRNADLQREFAQNGVRWRVEDAQRAGVHPMFALGINPSQATPQAIDFGVTGSGSKKNRMGDAIANAGQNISRAVAAQETVDERNERLMRLEVLRSEAAKNFALASSYASEARKPIGANALPDGVIIAPTSKDGRQERLETSPLFKDAVKLGPDEVVSHSGANPGITAGRGQPSMREFTMVNGDKVLLPASGQGGIPDEIDITMIPDIIGANIREYGGRAAILGALMRWFGGKLPDELRKPMPKWKPPHRMFR